MRKIHVQVEVTLDVLIEAEDDVTITEIEEAPLIISVVSPDERFMVQDFEQTLFDMNVTDSR